LFTENREGLSKFVKAAAGKERLDRLIVDRSLADSREKAQALIMAGEVTVDGRKASKAGQLVSSDSRIEVTAKQRYVGRGGLKLEGALQHFGINVSGLVAADFGSSTGGFTDCLLQAGVARVHAIDVGTGQLDWRLRNDSRVAVHEGVNARYIELTDLGEPVDLAVCDVSFISATLILPAMVRVLKNVPGTSVVVLVKPQFEAGKGQVGKGGIVRDPAQHEAACSKVRTCAEELGFATQIVESPITGAEGNKEFLLYGRR
jgi:23S rRNA (cytidine1920-2'-O)/16S rRNA (cytidine1409-2'-O)-methyltransferase